MLYHWHEFGHAAAWPGRTAAEMWLQFLNPLNPLTHTPFGRSAAAGCELFERATRRYAKPAFGIQTTRVAGHSVAVSRKPSGLRRSAGLCISGAISTLPLQRGSPACCL
jgi:poly-beta-hydroxyalkanoate depolymerase